MNSSAKIILLSNYPLDGSVSIKAFATCLEAELSERDYSVQLIVPHSSFSKIPAGPGFRKWLGYLDKFFVVPRQIESITAAQKGSYLIHLLDQAGAIYLPILSRGLHLLTCNDLIAIRSAKGELPEHRTRRSGRLLQKQILSGIKHARNIACISESTRNDLLRLSKTPPANVRTIPMGLNYHYKPLLPSEFKKYLSVLWPELDPIPSFILHVGGNQWYKNRRLVLETFVHLVRFHPHLKLVLAGASLPISLRNHFAFLFNSGQAVEMAHCSTAQLQALYSSARALFFPSLYEGFGWPIIEAQACDCPVVTSNRQPMVEVGGEGALYIDPMDAKTSASVLGRLISDPTLKEPLIRKGRLNVSRFSTGKMIDQYCQFYEHIFRSVKLGIPGQLSMEVTA